jgi:acyl carrier protein
VNGPQDSPAIATWLRGRLGQELGIGPEQVDLQRSPESYGIDSVVGVQICADLGDWLLGRELPADTLFAAPSLQAVCDQLAAGNLAAAGEVQVPAPLGAALARIDGGQQLVLLARVTRVVGPGDRIELARLPREPALLSVAYRHVDAQGIPGSSRYYGGLHMDRIRPWVQPVAVENGDRFGMFVHNAGDRALEITVVALDMLAMLAMEVHP